MARDYRRVTSFLRYALLGVLAGATVGGLTGFVLLQSSPDRLKASAVLFHAPGSGLSDSGRDFIAATLAADGFISGVAAAEGWDAAMADAIAGRLAVEAEDASRPLAELHLLGRDETSLAQKLDAITEAMVAWHQDRQRARVQSVLEELDRAIKTASRRQREFTETNVADPPLTAAGLDAIADAASLARQRLALELAARYRLKPESTLDARRRQRLLNAVVAEQTKREQVRDPRIDTNSATFERARGRAIAQAEQAALEQTKARLEREAKTFAPLQIVRPAEVSPLPGDSAPALVAVLAGGLIGLFAAGVLWSARESGQGLLSARLIEKSLNVPVLGVVADLSMTDGGTTPASSDSLRLARAGIRSLRTALVVLERDGDRFGAVMIAGLGRPEQTARLVVQLSAVAAEAGERVLIVDASSDDGSLAAIAGNAGGAALPPEPDITALTSERDADRRNEAGRIQLVASDAVSAVMEKLGTYFDFIVVNAGTAARGRRLMKHTSGTARILVCPANARPSALRKARAKTYHGIVLCDYPVDEAAYRSSPPLA